MIWLVPIAIQKLNHGSWCSQQKTRRKIFGQHQGIQPLRVHKNTQNKKLVKCWFMAGSAARRQPEPNGQRARRTKPTSGEKTRARHLLVYGE